MIPNIVFVILIALSTGYLTFLTTKGGLTDNKFKKIWKKLTRRGWLVVITLFITLVLLTSQEINNQILNRQAEIKLKNERNNRDSLITLGIKAGVDSSRKKLFQDLSAAFAQQDLRLDTINNTLEIIQNSPKTIITNFSNADPVLMLDKDGIHPKDKILSNGVYEISFKSLDQGSTNFNIVCYLLTEDYEGAYDLSKMNFFPSNLKLPKNSIWNMSFGSPSSPAAKSICVYLVGTYTSLDGSKSFKIDDLYKYEASTNLVSIPRNSEKKNIIEIIKSVPEKGLELKE